MRTDLGKVRGLGSAKGGTSHWWAQRVTAIGLVPLTVWFIVSLAALTGADHPTMVAWISNPFVTVLLSLFIISGFYHLKLGGQVIIEDYVHQDGVKLVSLLLLKFATLAVGLASFVALLKISFGS
ncbi:MAG: succinate dehydrogenase, hydrophobic membrane anchor protein [Sphingomonadales bacterium]|nr:succinate dehydrogenase, hydrophobic membrane anchor protein [Sphingomonadales bacterium]